MNAVHRFVSLAILLALAVSCQKEDGMELSEKAQFDQYVSSGDMLGAAEILLKVTDEEKDKWLVDLYQKIFPDSKTDYDDDDLLLFENLFYLVEVAYTSQTIDLEVEIRHRNKNSVPWYVKKRAEEAEKRGELDNVRYQAIQLKRYDGSGLTKKGYAVIPADEIPRRFYDTYRLINYKLILEGKWSCRSANRQTRALRSNAVQYNAYLTPGLPSYVVITMQPDYFGDQFYRAGVQTE